MYGGVLHAELMRQTPEKENMSNVLGDPLPAIWSSVCNIEAMGGWGWGGGRGGEVTVGFISISSDNVTRIVGEEEWQCLKMHHRYS